ncbi:MAG: Rhomboid family intrarane serine protease [Hyphomicrobiales bacterium]|nr:Rhomboid family intrarane serine protease [Hyphomicrobiales bacterium]
MHQRERLFNVPSVILWLVLGMALIHAVRTYALSLDADFDLLAMLAFTPARLTAHFDTPGVAAVMRALALRGSGDIEYAEFFFGDGSLQPWTVLTYAFLHADWMHNGLNSIWLVAFGAPVARRLGAARFLALFVVTAVLGVATHYALHAYDPMPIIGASAAVSGAMGASLRFVFQPGAPLGQALALNPDDLRAYRLPALPLLRTLRDRRVLTFILFWFVTNLIFGLAGQRLGLAEGGVAWEAHVGGFLSGLLLFSLFDPKPSDLRAQPVPLGVERPM